MKTRVMNVFASLAAACWFGCCVHQIGMLAVGTSDTGGVALTALLALIMGIYNLLCVACDVFA